MAKKRYYGINMHEMAQKTSKEDGDMLHSDPNEMANMPQDLEIKYYPKERFGYNDANLIDSYQGIDYQIEEDSMDQKRGRYPKKY